MQDASANSANSVQITISTLLRRIASELRALAATSDTLQDELSPVISEFAINTPETFAALQRLDEISQSLESLDRISEKLSHALPATFVVDSKTTFEQIPLSDLVNRLSGKVSTDEDNSDQSGDIDLF